VGRGEAVEKDKQHRLAGRDLTPESRSKIEKRDLQ
jgi:hypothetical protein